VWKSRNKCPTSQTRHLELFAVSSANRTTRQHEGICWLKSGTWRLQQSGGASSSQEQTTGVVCLIDGGRVAKTRMSDEWIMGATLGAYVVQTFVLYFWGSAFIHQWCGNSLYPLSTRDGRFPFYLTFLVPGVLVWVLDWAQMKIAQNHIRLVSHHAVRAALWINLIGIACLLVAVGSHYGHYGQNNGFSAIVSLLGMAFWPLGLAVSIGNLAWAFIQWVRASRVPTRNV
jgi:hypothetical protein